MIVDEEIRHRGNTLRRCGHDNTDVSCHKILQNKFQLLMVLTVKLTFDI